MGGGKEVDPTKVNLRVFDPKIDLHLLVHNFRAPIDTDFSYAGVGNFAVGGISILGGGLAWAQPRDPSSGGRLQPAVVSHELAHAIGYLLPDSPQSIKAPGPHCSSEVCLMNATTKRDGTAHSSFCACCRADMLDTHETMIADLRLRRVVSGKV